VIAAVIFAELLHAENFTQSRRDAKKFLTRIARIQCRPDGAGEFLVWVATKMSRLRRWEKRGTSHINTARLNVYTFVRAEVIEKCQNVS
jgi:hypothetical protein